MYVVGRNGPPSFYQGGAQMKEVKEVVVWNMFLFFHVLGMSSSQLTSSIIFQSGRAQPPISNH